MAKKRKNSLNKFREVGIIDWEKRRKEFWAELEKEKIVEMQKEINQAKKENTNERE